MGQPCIKSLAMISHFEKQGGGEVDKQIAANLQALVTKLLDEDFDEEEVSHLVGQLREQRCDRSEIGTVILSCLAYHEALDKNHANGDWTVCKEKWITACERFGISQWAAGQALSVGQHFRVELHGQPSDEIVQAVYDRFFNNEAIIAILKPGGLPRFSERPAAAPVTA